MQYEKPMWVMNQKEQSYDYLIVGSSRALNIIDANQVNKNTGLKGINIANSGSAFLENYLTLKQFLNNNTSRSVVLCVDIFGIISPDSAYNHPFHEYFFIPFLKDDTVYTEMRKHEGKLKTFTWKYLPIMGYFEYNNIFLLNRIFSTKSNTANFAETGGFEGKEGKEIASFGGTITKKKYRPDSASINSLKKIISLCKAKNVRLFFYSAPIYPKNYEKMIGKEACNSIIEGLCKKNSIPFFNLTTCFSNNDSTLFLNYTHLNTKGAQVFSKLIGDSLKKHF